MSKTIESVISTRSTPNTLHKARTLFDTGKVLSLHFNPVSNTYSSKVIGSKAYDVSIQFDINNSPHTLMCNCPFDWDGICKHKVATLLAIADLHKNQESFASKPLINSKMPLLPNNQILSKQLLKELLHPKILNQLGQVNWKVEIAKYKAADTMEISVIHDNYWESNHEKITLVRVEGGISVHCTCKHSQPYFCKHVGIFLDHFIERNKTPSILRLLDADFYTEEIERALLSYGLADLKNPEKALKLTAVDGQLVFELSKKYQGLVPVEGEHSKSFSDFFNKNILPTKSDSFLLNSIIESDDDLSNIGFGIVFAIDDYNPENIAIQAVTGKWNKKQDKFIGAVEPVDLAKLPQLETHQQEILKLLIEIENENESKSRAYDDDNSLLLRNGKIIGLLRKVFQLVSEKDLINLSHESFSYNLRISKRSLVPVTVNQIPARIAFEVITSKEFIELIPSLILGHEKIEIPWQESDEHSISEIMFNWKDNLYLVDDIDTFSAIQFFQGQGRLKTTLDKHNEFIQNYVVPLTKNFKIDMSRAKGIKIKEYKPKTYKKQLFFSEMADFIIIRPMVEYDGDHVQNILEKGNPLLTKNKTYTSLIRNEAYEASLYNFIRTLHPKLSKQFPHEFFHLKPEEMLQNDWFLAAFAKLKEENIEVYGFEKLKKFRYSPHPVKVNTSISSGIDWFEVAVDIAFGDIKVRLSEVKKAVLKKENYIKLSDGSLGVLPKEWLEKFESMFRQGEIKGETLQISSRKFMIIDTLFNDIDNEAVSLELEEKRKRLANFSSIKKISTPTGINATLRDYQREGLNWMNFLDEYRWGGILADDMGLGKTLQILSFLMVQKKKTKDASLIIVPTSLVFNWENEINKFCPSLKVHFYYGPDRKKDIAQFNGKHLIITTYGTMVNDIELLKTHNFNYIILDESQAIKNMQSLRYKAVRLLKGQNKLALTGTPIENNTFDLYAQMQFVNPGFLGSAKSFKEQFSQPIDKDNNSIVAAELKHLLLPFMIRRTKEQVATELPPKTEEVLYCTMGTKQREVYDAYRNKYRDYLLGKIEEEGLEKSKIYVLEGLTKLRQICDSPALLSDKEDYGADSVKIEELLRNIREKTGNHKIIVFSQFVKMLKLIKMRLQAENISFEYLDGQSTKKARQKSVEVFQEDEKCRVFLISLKAGGVGLNLTAADYVFLVDPWWNPAVENQAIDRCYRIGQNKRVFAYRMICKDSVEEKIIQYQRKKQAVANEIIQADENFMKKLSLDDIKGLFE